MRVLLLHPHAWVRLTSSQLYGLLFSKYTPDELVAIATQEDGSGRSRAKGGKSKKKRKSVQKKELLEYIHQETITKVIVIHSIITKSILGICFGLCIGSRSGPCLLYTTKLPPTLS
ncbi:MAG: hypothetical protein MJE68_03195 [Proteobacteria bacterium]|nr:hypothetical protein [Pseudomonadota bacterium]